MPVATSIVETINLFMNSSPWAAFQRIQFFEEPALSTLGSEMSCPDVAHRVSMPCCLERPLPTQSGLYTRPAAMVYDGPAFREFLDGTLICASRSAGKTLSS